MTLTELERLEALHSKPQQMLNEGDMKAYYYAAKELESALPKAFPEMAKALREALAKHNEALDMCQRYMGHLHKALKERDEARAEVERLKGEIDWLTEGARQEEQRLALLLDD